MLVLFQLRFYENSFLLFLFFYLELNRSLNFSGYICNMLIEGTVSQNFDLGPSFYFMTKKGNFLIFLQIIFLDFIKRELGPKCKIWDTVPALWEFPNFNSVRSISSEIIISWSN